MLKPWKDGWIENLCKVTGALWWTVFVAALVGLINPLTPDQYASGLYWGRMLNAKVLSISRPTP